MTPRKCESPEVARQSPEWVPGGSNGQGNGPGRTRPARGLFLLVRAGRVCGGTRPDRAQQPGGATSPEAARKDLHECVAAKLCFSRGLAPNFGMTEITRKESPKKRKPPTGDRHWQWKPGQSGNPGGRPNIIGEVRRLAQEHAPAAIARLAELMRSEDPRVSVTAASAILDRAVGRPEQALAISTTQAVIAGDVSPADAAATYAEIMRLDPTAVDLTNVRFLPAPGQPSGAKTP
jgi:hypothetical protein